jgi:hypothetical protein
MPHISDDQDVLTLINVFTVEPAKQQALEFEPQLYRVAFAHGPA